ncbi:hypothetical protein Fot_41865 [Forsythia ovata]|uniref:Uncharacterized protein n=1 Tax=Forsythia ovata TaxID=205694 RepID=A0ABD1RLB0_9LAMI
MEREFTHQRSPTHSGPTESQKGGPTPLHEGGPTQPLWKRSSLIREVSPIQVLPNHIKEVLPTTGLSQPLWKRDFTHQEGHYRPRDPTSIYHVLPNLHEEKMEKILIKRLMILKNNYTYKNVKLQMKWMMKFLKKNVGISIEQGIPTEAKSKVPQNVEQEVE